MNPKKKILNTYHLTFKIFKTIINKRYPNKSKVLKLSNEKNLAQKYEVSRASLRESLKILQSKGVILSKQKTGIEIEEISNWNFFDRDILNWTQSSKYSIDIAKYFLETRLIIEPENAYLCSERIDKKGKEKLNNAFDNLHYNVKNQDVKNIINADLEFHKIILFGTENPILHSFNSFISHILKYNFELNHKDYNVYEKWKIALPLHNNLKNHIISHKSKLAKRVMYKIINNTNKIK